MDSANGFQRAVALPEVADVNRNAGARGFALRADRTGFVAAVLTAPLVCPAARCCPGTRISPSAGMPGFAKPMPCVQLQLDADDLLHAVVAEVRILRSERGLRIDAQT